MRKPSLNWTTPGWLLRPGAVSRAQLSRVLGVAVGAPAGRASRGARLAPGQMPRHYSPRTPVVLHPRLSARSAASGPRDAWLFISRPAGRHGANVFWLDEGGDMRRAARRLFAMLRTLDGAGFRRIHAERPRGAGIAEALADRLARAASRRS